jgi:hypothetical protein
MVGWETGCSFWDLHEVNSIAPPKVSNVPVEITEATTTSIQVLNLFRIIDAIFFCSLITLLQTSAKIAKLFEF